MQDQALNDDLFWFSCCRFKEYLQSFISDWRKWALYFHSRKVLFRDFQPEKYIKISVWWGSGPIFFSFPSPYCIAANVLVRSNNMLDLECQ